MPSFIMLAQIVENNSVIKNFSSHTSERHILIFILRLDVGTTWKCPVFLLSSSWSWVSTVRMHLCCIGRWTPRPTGGG